MIIGTNWFLGWSHQTVAKDGFIKAYQDASKIADILSVYLEAGVDTVMGLISLPLLKEAVDRAQDRSGKKLIVVDTPLIPLVPGAIDYDAFSRILDVSVANGATFCLPHTSSTDALVDRTTRTIRGMDKACQMIRERGLIPGLSTHMPEAPVYADETGLDVATYIQIYNDLGFLMQVEVEWVHKVIQDAHRPVMTIKPMAAGRVTPLVGFSFVWNTIRDQDMVTVGSMTPYEARENIEISMSFLERRSPDIQLQISRSKASIAKQ
jgi:hypothetical protein